MKLLMSPSSPFVRKVRVLVLETGQTDAVTEVVVNTTALATAPEVIAANPTGKIPALIRDNGPALYDSRVITRFLDDRAQAGLYPAGRLWDVLTLEATADAILDAAVAMVYEIRLRPAEMQYETMMDAQWEKVSRALNVLNARWMSHLSGPLDMGQISVGCALGYLDFRHKSRNWRNGNDALAEWYATFSTRRSMLETVPA